MKKPFLILFSFILLSFELPVPKFTEEQTLDAISNYKVGYFIILLYYFYLLMMYLLYTKSYFLNSYMDQLDIHILDNLD